MLKLEPVSPIHLTPGATDLRNTIDGLAALVSGVFQLDPFSEQWFIFCNRQRDKSKILRWEHNGFWLYFRRLERGQFQWPSGGEQTLAISRRQVKWLLDGLSVESGRRTGRWRPGW